MRKLDRPYVPMANDCPSLSKILEDCKEVKPTQLQILADAFDRNERLTVLTAIHKYGIYALSQRCGELEKLGYPVDSRTIKTPTGKHVSEYFRGGVAYG